MSKTAEDHRREAGGELREKEDRREGSLPRDYIAQAYFGHWGGPETHQRARRRIDWMASQAEGERVLDVGCSEGILAILLAREGITVTAVDVNPDAIAYAKDLLQQEGSFVRDRVTFLKTDLYAAGLADGAFDTVMLGEVIEHLDQPALMIDRVAGLLKETGRLVLTTPFGYFPHEDHRQTFCLSDVVRLVGRHFSLAHIDVSDGYIRVVARKRVRGDGLSGQIDLATLFPLAEKAAIAAQRELYAKVQHTLSRMSGVQTELQATEKALSDAQGRLGRSQSRLAETSTKLRETKEKLRRTRHWLKKFKRVARRRKLGAADRIRRTLVTTPLLPRPVRRFFVRRLGTGRHPAATAVRRSQQNEVVRNALSGQKPRYLFICGCQRTGTTALVRILNRDVRIALGNERFRYGLPAPNDFAPELFFEPVTSGPEWARQHYGALQDRYKNAEIIGDKVPGYYNHFDTLAERFPSALFIFTVRDLYEVAASFNRRARDPGDTGWSARSDYTASVKRWNKSLRSAKRFAVKNPNIYIVLYDEFFSGDVRAYGLLYNFLGLEPQEECIAFFRNHTTSFRRSAPDLTEEERSYLERHADRTAEAAILWLAKRQ